MRWAMTLRYIPLQIAARDSRCRRGGLGMAGRPCEGVRESWAEDKPNKLGNYNRFNCLTSTDVVARFIGLSRLIGYIKVISMILLDTLKKITAEGLAFIKTQKDVSDAEIFVSSISHLLCRINYTSSIPCNGVEEPKSTLSYGIGVQAVFKEGNRKRIGFGSSSGDTSMEGVKNALEQGYHDAGFMDIGDEGLVALGWRALEGALNTFKEHNMMESIIVGGDVSIVQERMAIASTTGIAAWDEAANASASITAMIESDNAKGSAWEIGMRLSDFAPENAGKSAAMSAIHSRQGRRVPSGKYRLILIPQAVADLLCHVVLPSLTLSVVDASSSTFLKKYGERVADKRLAIFDHGA